MTSSPDLLSQAEPHQTAAEAERVAEVLRSLPPPFEAQRQDIAVSDAPGKPPVPQPSNDAAVVMSMMTQLVMSGEMTHDKVAALTELTKLQESMENRQAERAFSRSFVEMQRHLPRIKRDGTLEYPIDKNKPDGPKRTISKFAKWETIMEGIQPILSDHGFALSFKNVPRSGEGGGLGICAVLRHDGGHTEVGDAFFVPLDTSGGKNNAQAYRSSASYGQRGAATLALNIVTEGDDNDAKDLSDKPKLLSDEQIEQLLAKLKDAKINPGAFLGAHTDVQEIEHVRAESFVRLMNRIDAIARRANQGGQA